MVESETTAQRALATRGEAQRRSSLPACLPDGRGRLACQLEVQVPARAVTPPTGAATVQEGTSASPCPPAPRRPRRPPPLPPPPLLQGACQGPRGRQWRRCRGGRRRRHRSWGSRLRRRCLWEAARPRRRGAGSRCMCPATSGPSFSSCACVRACVRPPFLESVCLTVAVWCGSFLVSLAVACLTPTLVQPPPPRHSASQSKEVRRDVACRELVVRLLQQPQSMEWACTLQPPLPASGTAEQAPETALQAPAEAAARPPLPHASGSGSSSAASSALPMWGSGGLPPAPPRSASAAAGARARAAATAMQSLSPSPPPPMAAHSWSASPPPLLPASSFSLGGGSRSGHGSFSLPSSAGAAPPPFPLPAPAAPQVSAASRQTRVLGSDDQRRDREGGSPSVPIS